MGHATTERDDIRRSGKPFEPNPKKAKKPVEPVKAAQQVVFSNPEAKSPTKIKLRAKPKKREGSTGQCLPLGTGYQIKHKPGSGYSTLYRVVAERGHFAEVCELLEADSVNVKDPLQAAKLLDMMMVPIDKLDEFCRNDPVWQQHAKKKTAVLLMKIKEGDEKAKEVLENETRCNHGVWAGNLPEMLSTCVGYYNYLVDVWTKDKKAPKKPNKNVKKFQEAKVVFRRYPLNKGVGERAYVMMFPEKFIKQIKTAILTARAVDED